jgi:hypothetical protein
VAGGGGVGKQAHAMGDPFWGEGWQGAHRSGLVAARSSATEKKLVVERTRGHRWDSSGRRGLVGDGEACGVVSCAGGRRRESVDGELVRRKKTLGKSLRLRPLADILSLKRQPHVKGKAAVWTSGSDCNKGQRRWPAMVKSGSGRLHQEKRQNEQQCEGGSEGENDSLPCPSTRISKAAHVGRRGDRRRRVAPPQRLHTGVSVVSMG